MVGLDIDDGLKQEGAPLIFNFTGLSKIRTVLEIDEDKKLAHDDDITTCEDILIDYTSSSTYGHMNVINER